MNGCAKNLCERRCYSFKHQELLIYLSFHEYRYARIDPIHVSIKYLKRSEVLDLVLEIYLMSFLEFSRSLVTNISSLVHNTSHIHF